jgi:hypothetical protein
MVRPTEFLNFVTLDRLLRSQQHGKPNFVYKTTCPQICPKNLSEKFVRKICPKNLSEKFVGQICPTNLSDICRDLRRILRSKFSINHYKVTYIHTT